MRNTNDKVLELINKLPGYMIEEWQEANFLPYKGQTIESLSKFIKRKLIPDFLGYTEEITKIIDTIYKEIEY